MCRLLRGRPTRKSELPIYAYDNGRTERVPALAANERTKKGDYER